MSEFAIIAKTDSGADISERSDVSVCHLACSRGSRASLDDIARATFGGSLPFDQRAVDLPAATVVWAGPDQWLVIEPQRASGDRSTELAKIFNGLASVVDVSDSRAIYRLAEAQPSDGLKRGMGIDIDERAFKPGDVAITHVAHLGVIVWRLPDGSGYDFGCARTYAREFLGWLRKI